MTHTPLPLQIKMALTGAVMWGSAIATTGSFVVACVTPLVSTRTVVGLAAGEWWLAAIGFLAVMVAAMYTLGRLADRDHAIREAQAQR